MPPSSRKKRSNTCCRTSGGMPGPSSATVRSARWPSSEAASRTCVPGGVWTSAFSTRIRPIWRMRSASPRASTGAPYSTSSACPVAVARGVNSAVSSAASPARSTVSVTGVSRPASSRDRSSRSVASFARRATCSRIDARNSSRVAGSSSGLLEQLEEAAEREERRAQLVRGVGDELAARAVERREPEAHPLERRARAGRPRRVAASTTGSSKFPAAIRSAACSSRRSRRANRRARRVADEHGEDGRDARRRSSSRRRTTLTVWSWRGGAREQDERRRLGPGRPPRRTAGRAA